MIIINEHVGYYQWATNEHVVYSCLYLHFFFVEAWLNRQGIGVGCGKKKLYIYISFVKVASIFQRFLISLLNLNVEFLRGKAKMLGLWVHVTCAWFRPWVVFLHYKRIYLRLRLEPAAKGNISVTLIYRCRYGRLQLSVTIDGADKSYNCGLIQLCEYNVQVIAGPIFFHYQIAYIAAAPCNCDHKAATTLPECPMAQTNTDSNALSCSNFAPWIYILERLAWQVFLIFFLTSSSFLMMSIPIGKKIYYLSQEYFNLIFLRI